MEKARKKTDIIVPRLVADASSLILLQRLGLLKRFARPRRFQTTAHIFSELEKGASESERDEFKESVVIHDVNINIDADLPSKLSLADASVLVLYHHGNSDAVLSEDRILLTYCKKKNIVHYCCLSLLSPLVQSGLLTDIEARTLFPKIANAGRYSNRVIEIAQEMLMHSIRNRRA